MSLKEQFKHAMRFEGGGLHVNKVLIQGLIEQFY
jgi:hypothetical protein